MKTFSYAQRKGFTLIEVLIALVILSILALMSYRGLSTVLDTRAQVAAETNKWKKLSSFFTRFEQDIQLAAPYSVRRPSGNTAAWLGKYHPTLDPQLEFSRFSSSEDTDTPRRVAYRLNDKQEIELWLWSGLDVAPDALPAHYPVLRGVTGFELQYMTANQVWADNWPTSPNDASIPLAVQMRITLVSGEQIVRIFSLGS